MLARSEFSTVPPSPTLPHKGRGAGGARGGSSLLEWGAGHINAIVSEVSPTKSRDSANSTGSVRSMISARNMFGLA